MTTQDYAALAICGISAAWLLHRLVLRYLPAAKKPDVTAASLIRRTRERRAAQPTPPGPRGDSH